ncbi:MAG: hypothetical protein JXB85_14495 [Anaerolineales bacterium]|nr:hypothetical protein [Anaerolineales bacterium]
MRKFLELFARQWFFFLALMLAVGIPVTFDLDARIGMLVVGVVFCLSGTGNVLVAPKEIRWRGLHQGAGIFLILLGLLTIATMVIMFARGEQMSGSSS